MTTQINTPKTLAEVHALQIANTKQVTEVPPHPKCPTGELAFVGPTQKRNQNTGLTGPQ